MRAARLSDLRRCQVRRGPLAGFTIIELMVSLAMVLLLVAGINAVFQAATRTAGTGMVVEEVTRSHRSLERVLADDFRRAVPLRDMPCLTLYSMQRFAFFDRKDQYNDADARPETADLDASGTEQLIPPAIYGQRNHRLDRLAFFVRSEQTPFYSQTPNQLGPKAVPELVTFASSPEGWCWYGHVRLPDRSRPQPDPSMDYFNPGEGGDNAFACDWRLGRMLMLLKPGTTHDFIMPRARPSHPPLAPLAADSHANKPLPSGSGDWLIQHGRFDVALGTILAYRELLLSVPAGPNDPLPAQIARAFDYRFNARAGISRGPSAVLQPDAVAADIALASSILQRAVVQFIVEFAGDYVIQNPDTGEVAGVGRDGEIDYLVPWYPDGSRGPRRIRWYGMPRNIDTGDDTGVRGPVIFRPSDPTGHYSRAVDVLPLSDVLGGQVPFEFIRDGSGRLWPITAAFPPAGVRNYAAVNGWQTAWTYICAWGPEELEKGGWGPRLIRLIVTFADANARFPAGQTAEFVYALHW